MGRSKAALTHLGISLAALLILTILTFFVWYPYPHFKYEGVLSILLITAFVDVVIGPVLTLYVVKPGKPLRLIIVDLVFIAMMQIAAFGYGTLTIQSQHPEFLLYVNGEFKTISSSQVDLQEVQHDPLRQPFYIAPKLVMFVEPTDPTEQAEVTLAFLTEGKSAADFPRYFSPYQPTDAMLESQAIGTDQLFNKEPNREKIEAYLLEKKLEASDVYFFPMISYLKSSLVIVDRKNAELIGYLDLNPY